MVRCRPLVLKGQEHPYLHEYPPIRGGEAVKQKEINEAIQRKLWRWKQKGLRDLPMKGVEWYHGFRDHRSPERIEREGIERRGWTLETVSREAESFVEKMGLADGLELGLWASDVEGPRTIWVTHRREDGCSWAERTPEPVFTATWNAIDKIGDKAEKGRAYERAFQLMEEVYGKPYMAVLNDKLPINVCRASGEGVPLGGMHNCDTGMDYIPPEMIKEVKPCLSARYLYRSYGRGPVHEWLEGPDKGDRF